MRRKVTAEVKDPGRGQEWVKGAPLSLDTGRNTRRRQPHPRGLSGLQVVGLGAVGWCEGRRMSVWDEVVVLSAAVKEGSKIVGYGRTSYPHRAARDL